MRAIHSDEAFAVAFQTLPQDELEGRFQEYVATPPVTHPVVISHPVTGRKALYVNASFTQHFEGWTAAESKPLLQFLFEHAAQIDFTYRFQWEPGSIAMWDNRCTWHRALGGHEGHGRVMDRITLDGCAISA